MQVTRGGIYLYEPPSTANSENAATVTTSGSEQSGLRPFIIVSQDHIHLNKPTAVGVPLTSKTQKANSYRILLPSAELIPDTDYEFVNSVALCDHVRVVDTNRIRETPHP